MLAGGGGGGAGGLGARRLQRGGGVLADPPSAGSLEIHLPILLHTFTYGVHKNIKNKVLVAFTE